MEFCLQIIVPSVVSIIGFIVTIVITNIQFKNAKKERIIESQFNVYVELYKKIEPIINSLQLIFQQDYYNNVLSLKAEMKIVASSSTLRCYKKYLEFLYDNLMEYNTFCAEHDPTLNVCNVESVINEDTGEECEILHVAESDMSSFEFYVEKYQKENCPKGGEIKKYLKNLLNSMREDLGYESIEMDIIE